MTSWRRPIEQKLEIALSVWAVEHIVFLDLHHRQPAPLRVDAVVVFGELLLECEQFLPRRKPLVLRDDRWMRNGPLLVPRLTFDYLRHLVFSMFVDWPLSCDWIEAWSAYVRRYA